MSAGVGFWMADAAKAAFITYISKTYQNAGKIKLIIFSAFFIIVYMEQWSEKVTERVSL